MKSAFGADPATHFARYGKHRGRMALRGRLLAAVRPAPQPTHRKNEDPVNEPVDINAIIRDPDDPRYPTLLGVRCDGEAEDPECHYELEADFLVHEDDERDTRLGYVLDYAARQGWTVVGRDKPGSARTFCPYHKAAAGVPA